MAPSGQDGAGRPVDTQPGARTIRSAIPPKQLLEGRNGSASRFHNKAYRFRQGHRIRLAISSSYWPMIWPAPEVARIKVRLAGTSLTLPVLDTAPQPLRRPVSVAACQPRAGTLSAAVFAKDNPASRARSPTGRSLQDGAKPFTSLRFNRTDNNLRCSRPRPHIKYAPICQQPATSRFEHRLRFERAGWRDRSHRNGGCAGQCGRLSRRRLCRSGRAWHRDVQTVLETRDRTARVMSVSCNPRFEIRTRI